MRVNRARRGVRGGLRLGFEVPGGLARRRAVEVERTFPVSGLRIVHFGRKSDILHFTFTFLPESALSPSLALPLPQLFIGFPIKRGKNAFLFCSRNDLRKRSPSFTLPLEPKLALKEALVADDRGEKPHEPREAQLFGL